MFRRAIVLLALGSVLGVLFATFLGPQPARGADSPPELKAEPARATRTAKDISRPMIEATAKVRPAVVKIVTFRDGAWGRRYRGNGSGFIVAAEGHVLTHRRVLAGNSSTVIELADGRKFEKVALVGADRRSDVAVLKLLETGDAPLPVVTLGDSDDLEVGELVIAIGAPYGLDSSVSLGVVSATGRTGIVRGNSTEDFIQTDAALNPGNSGGPLINLDGQVVGINTAIQGSLAQANIGIGYAVPVNLARSVALALIEHGVARRGYLGVSFERVLDARQLEALGIEGQGGVRLRQVVPDSPAARAGLKPGDIITAVDGRPLKDARLFVARLAQAGPGGTVDLIVHRDSERKSVEVTLDEERPVLFGLEVATLDQERAATLRLNPRLSGVVVTRVEEGSAAARAPRSSRILPGDVIVQIDWDRGYRQITNRDDFEEVMEYFRERPPEQVRFWIVTPEGRFAVVLDAPRDS